MKREREREREMGMASGTLTRACGISMETRELHDSGRLGRETRTFIFPSRPLSSFSSSLLK